MSYSHFSTIERGQLEALHRLGWSTRAIGRQLDRHHSSIARELKRNETMAPYSPVEAQSAYERRRERSKPFGKRTPQLVHNIEEKLELTWSPEQIVGRLASSGEATVSFKTIYRWLYQGLVGKGALHVLRHKGKSRRPKEIRGRFNVGKSIRQRPKEVRKRESFGHWELDTVVSSRGKSKGCVATFAERKTRLYQAIKMPDRTAASMKTAFSILAGRLPKGTFQTATVDRGKEFACYEDLESAHEIAIYFADPYSSWQRGTNENANGLLREFFPKKTDFDQITESELNLALSLINNRPRKCLGWKTANESFMESLSHLA
jgi:transposase, IS30 family